MQASNLRLIAFEGRGRGHTRIAGREQIWKKSRSIMYQHRPSEVSRVLEAFNGSKTLCVF
jgi:hypothetical protein